MGLNVEQQEAVVCDDHCMILAPPGSGKTGTLVAKCKHIISSDKSSQVLLVTFTDASSKEAHERIAKTLSADQLRRIRVATFHKHAMEQLRQSNALGQILGPRDADALLKKALRQADSVVDFYEAKTKLDAYKATPDFSGEEEDFVARYESLKTAMRAIDLQDVIRECVWGMRPSENSRKVVTPLPCTHILCDEFQDVDWNQFYWLLEYAKAGATVTVVGDDDQSVYGFRNSLGYQAMEAFIEALKPTVINLKVNYRSKREILVAATCLIRNNVNRMDKEIASQKGDGGQVFVKSSATVEDASGYILDLILEDAQTFPENAEKASTLVEGYAPPAGAPILKWKLPKQRWAIIGRTNRDLWLMSSYLRSADVPYTKPPEKDIQNEVLMYCNFLESLQIGKPIGLEQVLAAIGIPPRTVDQVHERMGQEFFRVMDGILPQPLEVPIEEEKALKEFASICSKWRSLLNSEKDGKPVAYYARVIDAVGYYFTESIIRHEDAVADFKAFLGLLKKSRGPLNLRVQSFLRPEENQSSAGVSLCTMHGSKGLEFDHVVLVQCNSGSMPSGKAQSVEEERRLFYVAITRPRLKLWMQYIGPKGPSTFLNEIGNQVTYL